MTDLPRWGRPIGITVVAALAIYAIAISQTQPQTLLAAAAQIGPTAALAGGLVCLLSIAPRFLRWQLLLQRLGRRPHWRPSLRIYWAGIALTWTPGKLGETLRSALLRPHGVAVPDSLAAFLADRLSDVIGVALLGLVAAGLAGRDTGLFTAIALLGVAGSLAAAHLIRRGRLVPAAWRFAAPVRQWALLWSPVQVPCWVALAALAYGLQALVFAAFVSSLAPGVDWAACVAIFAAAIFVGAASLAPAGLGAMEATLAFALTAAGIDWTQAVAATLLTRLCSLWIPSGLGVLALLGLMRDRPQPLPAAPA